MKIGIISNDDLKKKKNNHATQSIIYCFLASQTRALIQVYRFDIICFDEQIKWNYLMISTNQTNDKRKNIKCGYIHDHLNDDDDDDYIEMLTFVYNLLSSISNNVWNF